MSFDLLREFVTQLPYRDLLVTLGILSLSLVLMLYYRLSIVGESLISAARLFFQLAFIGGIFLVFFDVNSMVVNVLACFFMVGVASVTAAQQSPKSGALSTSFLAQATAAVITILPATLMGVIDVKASFFLPIAAMVIRNTLDRAALTFERLDREYAQHRDLVEGYLALGIDPATASEDLMKESVEASMIPTLNKMKVIGLVGLPGLMTGLILGAERGELTEVMAYAVSLQAGVYYLIFTASVLASILVTTLIRGSYFNDRHQLILAED